MINISVEQVLREIQTKREIALPENKNDSIIVFVHWTGYSPLKDGFILSGYESDSLKIIKKDSFAQETFEANEAEESMTPKIKAMIEKAKEVWEKLPSHKKKLH